MILFLNTICYFYIIGLGLIIGLLGALFNKTLLKTQDLYSKIKFIPKQYKLIIPLMISIVLGFLLPQVLGGGHELIVSLVKQNTPILLLLTLLLVKFLFTMASFGSGAPGGIFLPLLSIGALIGNVYGYVLTHFFGLDSSFISNFIILAMAGYFTAIVRAPITGIILITEMTGSFNHLLSLSVISITAYIIADVIGSLPVYDALLGRILKNQGNSVSGENNIHKDILEFSVCMGSDIDGKKIKSIKWPSHCLLVAVRRGEQEIIPKGDTVINAGDYLVVLTDDNRVPKINDMLLRLTGSCETERR
jgi:H+/Cl- antiporter ClcA